MIRFRLHVVSRRAFLAVAASSFAALSLAQSARPLAVGRGQNTVVTIGGAGDAFARGIELNGFLGAKTFYNAGYTGTGATIANIEGGLAFTGHQMTSKISQVFSGTGALTGNAAITTHATQTTSIAGGYNAARPYDGLAGPDHTSYSSGIAYGANLWTGNIATSISGNNFDITTNSLFTTYYNALIGGVSGATANIATSSWGSTSNDLDTQRQIAAGLTLDALSIDAIVAVSHKLVVFAAGNNGGLSGDLHTVGSPASGNNALVVGATSPNNVANPSAAFVSRAGFSAYGPNTAFIATGGQAGTIVDSGAAQRARVDILAPGIAIIGATPGGAGGYAGADGTSFATPLVAGGAALIEDAGQALGYTNATDNRVVTAILQNSATKLAGWTNGAATGGDGVSRTTRALDYGQGAGQMNLARAYDQLTGGTHDATIVGGRAVVQEKGWDFGDLTVGGKNDYFLTGGSIGGALAGGSTFTATMRFNGGVTFGTLGSGNTVSDNQLQFQYLSNFSLQLYNVTFNGGGFLNTSTLVAESNAQYITSEHFQYVIPTTGFYALRVNYLSDVYNVAGAHGAVGYGLAWNGTQAVPEPASLAALGLGALAMLRRRRQA